MRQDHLSSATFSGGTFWSKGTAPAQVCRGNLGAHLETLLEPTLVRNVCFGSPQTKETPEPHKASHLPWVPGKEMERCYPPVCALKTQYLEKGVLQAGPQQTRSFHVFSRLLDPVGPLGGGSGPEPL